MNIRVPVVHIKASQYLIGINKVSCEMRGNMVMIRVGGGYETFKSYLSKNYKYFEKMLTIIMIKSDYTLEKVVDCLIQGVRITHFNKPSIRKSIQKTSSADFEELDSLTE